MRLPLTFLLATALAVVPAGWVYAQEAATQPSGARVGTIQRAATQPAATRSAATQQLATQPVATRGAVAADGGHTGAHPPRRSPARHAQPRHAGDAVHASAPPVASAGVLSLGATDITGNKELPKVMVIVPWKGSLGASGVIKPTDSLLDEMLQPVDRGVFQRRIRYYGQLNGAADARPSASRVAPVGDTQ